MKKAAILADMHLRSLRQKMMLLQLTEESAKKLEVTSSYSYQRQHQPLHAAFPRLVESPGFFVKFPGPEVQGPGKLWNWLGNDADRGHIDAYAKIFASSHLYYI